MKLSYATLGVSVEVQQDASTDQIVKLLAAELERHVARNTEALMRHDLSNFDLFKEQIGQYKDKDLTPEDDADEVLFELEDALNWFAPPYSVFTGPMQVDGKTSYGFKPDIEGLEDDAASGDVLKVNDTSEVPFKHKGFVMHVNDHGNVTLYEADGFGRLGEIWAVV